MQSINNLQDVIKVYNITNKKVGGIADDSGFAPNQVLRRFSGGE